MWIEIVGNRLRRVFGYKFFVSDFAEHDHELFALVESYLTSHNMVAVVLKTFYDFVQDRAHLIKMVHNSIMPNDFHTNISPIFIHHVGCISKPQPRFHSIGNYTLFNRSNVDHQCYSF